MELSNIKLNLARKLLDTNDKELLGYIKAVLDTHPTTETWYEDLPDEIKANVDQGLLEAEQGLGISHKEAMKKYAKWPKK